MIDVWLRPAGLRPTAAAAAVVQPVVQLEYLASGSGGLRAVFKNSLFGCSGSGSAVLAIGSGSGFRVYPILDPSPTPKNPNPEIYPDRGPMRFFSKIFRFSEAE